MTVYVDLLLFFNVAVDSALLWLTARLLRRPVSALRFLGALALMCLYGMAVCFPAFAFAVNVFLRVSFAALIVLTAFDFHSPGHFFSALGVFFAVTLAYAGIVLACRYVLPGGENTLYFQNGSAYLNVPASHLLLAILVLCVVQIVLDRTISRRRALKHTCRCAVTVNGQQAEAVCLIDTGNLVRDAITGLPVVLLSRRILEPLVRFTAGGTLLCDPSSPLYTRLRMIPFRSAGQSGGLLQAFRPDRFTADGREYKVLIAVNPVEVSGGEYAGIVPVLE